jgi:PilZ domain
MAATRKRDERKLLGQPAWITLDGGFAARQCVVADISRTGARILLDDAVALTSTLKLALSRDARTGHSCVVAWQRGKEAGLKFVS